MSILLPDRHGKHDATDDSRLSLDASDPTLRGFLTDTHGLLILGVGNPFLFQDFYEEGGGSNANFGIFRVFGNRYSTSPGYVGLQFQSYGRAGGQFPERFALRFRPNGGTQNTLTAYSAQVTADNCAYVVIERVGDDYSVNLYDKSGVKTAGTPVTHNTGSLGALLRSSAYTVYLGGMEVGFPAQQFPQYNVQLENFVLIQQSTAIASVDTKIQNLINGSSPVTEFGVANVKLWRTLKDLSSSSLAAEPTATTDIYPALVNPATSRSIAGSPIGAVDPSLSVNLDENKYNFSGILAGDTTATISISGAYFGSVTSVEARLLNRETLAEVEGWVVVDASPSGNTWSGEITGVSPGDYCIEVRPSNSPSTVYEGRNPWIVGYIMMILGQSQNAIAFKSKGAEDAGFTLPSLPSTANPYIISTNRNPSYGWRPSYMRADGAKDLPDALLFATIEWERLNPGVPVVWANMSKEGSSVDNWLDNDTIDGTYSYFGDGSTLASGIVTDLSRILGTDKANIILSWGTSDLTNTDYENKLDGFIFDDGTGFTGASYKHVSDLFSSSLGLAHTPLTRAISDGIADNFTSDPASDNYPNSERFREEQAAIIEGWKTTKSGKVVSGPSVNDMTIEAIGGPHQPTTAEGETAYMRGSPRLGARWGHAAGMLVDSTSYTLPSLPDQAYFVNDDRDSFTINVNTGSFGAVKNNDATTDVSGFELSEDSGTTWNRKGFTASYSGNTVTFSKDSGDWSLLADGALRWRYHRGGPYSYGTDYVTEMRADIDKALYAAADNENGVGVPVTQKTDIDAGGQEVSAPLPQVQSSSKLAVSVSVSLF